MKLILICSTLASLSRVLRCLNYTEATLLNLLCFGKDLEVQEMPGRLLHVEQVLGCGKDSWSR